MRYRLSKDAKMLIEAKAQLFGARPDYYYRKFILPSIIKGDVPNDLFVEAISKGTSIIRTVYGARICRLSLETLKGVLVRAATKAGDIPAPKKEDV